MLTASESSATAGILVKAVHVVVLIVCMSVGSSEVKTTSGAWSWNEFTTVLRCDDIVSDIVVSRTRG